MGENWVGGCCCNARIDIQGLIAWKVGDGSVRIERLEDLVFLFKVRERLRDGGKARARKAERRNSGRRKAD